MLLASVSRVLEVEMNPNREKTPGSLIGAISQMGLTKRRLSVLLSLSFLTALFEIFGVSIFLPIFQYVRLDGNPSVGNGYLATRDRFFPISQHQHFSSTSIISRFLSFPTATTLFLPPTDYHRWNSAPLSQKLARQAPRTLLANHC